MALPEKKIKSVTTPDNQVYDIVPEMLQNNGFAANVPSLTADSTLVLTDYIKYAPHYPAMTGTAAKTSSPYNHSKWDATDSTIDTLYDGLMLVVKVPVAGNGTYGTAISVNGGDYHPVVYNISSMIGTRYSVNSTIVVVYNSAASGNLYINDTAATSVTGC